MFGYITIIMLGDRSVGRSVLRHLVRDKIDLNAIMHIEAEKVEATLNIGGEAVHLKIWYTARAVRCLSLRKLLSQQTNGFMLVYDISQKSTLAYLKSWMQDIQNFSYSEVQAVLIAYKEDLAADYDVAELDSFARRYNMPYYLTSARTGQNIREAFVHLSSKIIDKSIVLRESLPRSHQLEPAAPPPKKKGCC
jgi:GTPase SAR1 family protein